MRLSRLVKFNHVCHLLMAPLFQHTVAWDCKDETFQTRQNLVMFGPFCWHQCFSTPLLGRAKDEAFQTRHNLVIVGHLLMAHLFQHSVAWEGKQ